jgi:CRISPR-associated endoribonuclease Cas6
MLASFVIDLKPQQVAPLGQTLGRSLHAVLLRLIAEVDPALATALHADAKTKPFTVSMLQGRFVTRNGRQIATPDEIYQVRYTVLSDEVFGALSNILLGKYMYKEPVRLDGNLFDIAEIVVRPELSDGWARLDDFESLWNRAEDSDRITLDFASPTTFRTGDVNLLFPLPVSVFGGLMRKWEAFAPIALPAELGAFIAEHLVVERYRLETRVVAYDNHQYNGFVGTCQFRVLGDRSEQGRAINALADLALFTGIGQKTTQGLGQTRRIGR